MSESINITINGQVVAAKQGDMLIDVADANGITIPRFCYHKKLSVSANCRMCLVEVEKAPKPLPACATPINDGMVIKTRSAAAIAAQKSTMEFLLINHPLDCPVCDQGGECELQDVAMGFGDGVSQYSEQKRVVRDKNIGSLIATEMTRCIHCTRCVRFSEEIAGMPELGATGRGEFVEIGTYVEKTLASELSGNVIDVCPVGALTAKPSRFAARCWEMTQTPSIAPHDCIGSNIYIHSMHNDVIRVVPNDNDAINECWISDRDRFSYSALKSEQRLLTPKIKKEGVLVDASWDDAIALIMDKFSAQASSDATKLAALISPSSSLEEQYLLQKLLRALGSDNIDYRLKQTDFSADSTEMVMPWLGRSIESINDLDAALFIASNVRKEQPVLGHRVRQAVVHHGAEISFLNHVAADLNYSALANIASGSAEKLVHELAAIVVAVATQSDKALSEHLARLLEKVKAKDEHQQIAQSLVDGDASALFIGQQGINSPFAALIKEMAEFIAQATHSTLGVIPAGANASGAALAGCVPFAQAGGVHSDKQGLNKDEILAMDDACLVLSGIDPRRDLLGSLKRAAFCVAISSYFDADSYADVDVVLPKAAFSETSGTFVNIEGRWQSFSGAVKAKGESRPGWQIINSLMRLLLPASECSFDNPLQARDELKVLCESIELNNYTGIQSPLSKLPSKPRSLKSVYEESLYTCDELVRYAQPLQDTEDFTHQASVAMNLEQAHKEQLVDVASVKVSMGDDTAEFAFRIDERVPTGCVLVPHGLSAQQSLPHLYHSVSVEAV